MNLGILFGVIATLIAYTDGTDDYTLPSTVTPSHYSLTLYIDPDYDFFNGSVTITFVTSEKTKTISLHASPNYIEIKNVARISDNLRTNVKDDCNVDSANNITEIVTITCMDEFPANKEQQLTIYFDGEYAEESHGIFKAEYKDNDTTERMVATQFEPTYARRVFPCFDEPQFKTTFKVTVYHPEEYNVISNTAFTSNRNKETKFRITPSMSSYLLAFAVSKFEPTISSDDTLEFAVYSRPSVKSRTGTAVKYGPILLKYLRQYLKIAYSDLGNNKMDMIAVPEKFGGAMENWGLITFSELDLLDDENETTANQKQIIVSTMAHELAHQWFGNYVTLDWWSNTWLNEGFATFFQYLIPDNIEGDDDLAMDLSKQFIIEIMSNALQIDSYSSNPLSNKKDDIQTQDKISGKFDDISYNKGASVIRMMQNVLGVDHFKQALEVYLATNKLHNTDPSKLFAALQSVYQENYDLSKELESFIYESGYPLVTATLANSTLIRITQEPFKILEEKESKNTIWNIPLNYKTFKEENFNTVTDQWINEDGFEITIKDDDWVILNLGRTGYYRVNYDKILWERIIDQLKGDNSSFEMDVLNRAQLIDDVFNVARTGKVSYEIAFNLAEYLKTETEYYPWAAFFNAVPYLMEHISDNDTLDLLKKITLGWIKNAFPDFIQNSTDHIDILRDNLINQWKCALGDDDCLDYVKTVFDSVQKGDSFKNINDRYLVYCNAFTTSSNSKEVYEFLMQKLKDSDSAYERNEILKALACSQFQTQYLAELLSNDTVISLGEVKTVFNAIIDKGEDGPMNIIMFLMDSAEDVVEKYKNFVSIPSLAYKIAMKSNNDAHLKMVLNDMATHNLIDNVNEIITTVDSYVKVNSDWKKSYSDKIKKQLKKMDGSAGNMLYPQIFVNLLPLSLAILFVVLL